MDFDSLEEDGETHGRYVQRMRQGNIWNLTSFTFALTIRPLVDMVNMLQID